MFTERVQKVSGAGDQGQGNAGFGYRHPRLYESQECHGDPQSGLNLKCFLHRFLGAVISKMWAAGPWYEMKVLWINYLCKRQKKSEWLQVNLDWKDSKSNKSRTFRLDRVRLGWWEGYFFTLGWGWLGKGRHVGNETRVKKVSTMTTLEVNLHNAQRKIKLWGKWELTKRQMLNIETAHRYKGTVKEVNTNNKVKERTWVNTKWQLRSICIHEHKNRHQKLRRQELG